MRSLMRALRRRPFALLWSGQSLSLFGDRIFQIALSWWVLEKTGFAAAMATIFTISIVPMLVFLLVGGALVDRFPRIRLMIISDVVRGLLVAVMALLAARNTLMIEHVYVISLVSGFVEAFFQPAYRAALPEVTPEADLTSANSLTSLSGQFAGILGPAIGAFVVALGGTPLAFATNALSFLISALCLLPLLKGSRAPQQTEAAHGLLGDVRVGLKAVAASPWLWVTIAVAGVSNIAYAGPMEVLLPFRIEAHPEGSVAVLGWFYSASSLGAVLAAIWVGRLPRLRRRGWTMYGAWMLTSLMVIVIGLPVPVVGLLLAGFIIGAGGSVLGLAWSNTLQERVPAHLLGRVSSVDYLGSYILLPLGYAIGGWGAEKLGAPLVFVIGGVVQTLLIALGLFHKEVRSLD